MLTYLVTVMQPQHRTTILRGMAGQFSGVSINVQYAQQSVEAAARDKDRKTRRVLWQIEAD